ncbi:DUF1062 domain-containing protein [Streptomyces sp. NPDC002530]
MLNTWVVTPTCLPLVARRCHTCGSDRFRPDGKFRVNANHKLLDVWILVLCTGCGETAKLTILERTHIRSIRPEFLDRVHHNDCALTRELLEDPLIQHRNRLTLDWGTNWRLDTGGSDHLDSTVIDVAVRFAARIPIRPTRLIAQGCALSRAEVERLLAKGNVVSAVRLSSKLAADFTFILKR